MTTPSRLVRVFISSTFRDFIEERDELVKKVFPELRRRCKERFVEVLEVDLRWGITEEQSKSGETLRICLEEIDRCRSSAPVFFVGLLGERYGWIPPRDYFKPDVLEDPNLSWVKEHIDGKSVTELEILHGVLRNEIMRDKSFFYFRNDGYQERHWDAIASHHEGILPPLTKEDFTNSKSPTPEADAAKQRDLKQRVRDVSFKWDPKDYETPQDLASLILEDLWAAINDVFPASSVPDENDRQKLEHEAFGLSRIKGYIPRLGLFEQLDGVFTSPTPSVKIVTGESGSGKSALLAAWISNLGPRIPERHFIHYIGGTPESASVGSIIRRLMAQIRAWGAVADPIPDDLSDAVELLPIWLQRSVEGQKDGVLIALDALNQIDNEWDKTLWWLPKDLPEGVRVVASTLTGSSQSALEKRGWTKSSVSVPLLGDDEKRTIIVSYLANFSKRLAGPLADRLVKAPQAANPLFLRVVLDELRLRARHENLASSLDKMLQAKDPVELYVQVLQNLEEFDKDRPNLVREAMGYLAAARRGLTESELLQLLSMADSPATNPLPRHLWSPLYLALEDSLVSRNGQLGFFHDYLRQAVEVEYLDEEWEREKIHARFGEVAEAWNTERFSPSLRRYGLGHGAWHLRIAGYHEKLWAILKNEYFRAAQIEEFKRVDEVLAGLKNGIATYCLRKGRLPTDDARLAWMALKCGEVVQGASRNLAHLLKSFLSTPSMPSDDIKDTLERLKTLDASAFFHASLFLVYSETLQSQKAGTSLSSHFLKFMNQEMAMRLGGTVEVVPEVFQEAFARLLPAEFWASIKSMTQSRKNICKYFEVSLQDDFEHLENLLDENFDTEGDAVLADEAMNFATQKNWSVALGISAQLMSPQSRSDVLYAISRAQSEHGLLHDSLCTFAAACTQASNSSKKDWSSLGELCIALASKLKVNEALQLSATIEDARVRAATMARVASLTCAGDKELAIGQLQAALNEAAQLGQSGYLTDVVAEILSAIEQQEVLHSFQLEVEKCVEEVNDEVWRSAGFKVLAENQSRLGLFAECLKTIQKISRYNLKAAAYASVALAFYRQEKADDAAHLFALSIKTIESCKEGDAKAESIIFFGDCLSQVGELHGKSEWLKQAVEMAMNIQDATLKCSSIRSIAMSLNPLELIMLQAKLTDTTGFWHQFHMHVAFTPALMKTGRLKEVEEIIETACRHLQRIEFSMSPQDAAEAFNFIIDTCSKMDFDISVLGNSGLNLVELAILGHDSNYMGLLDLMCNNELYSDALQIVPLIATSANRVKALSRAVAIITRNIKPTDAIVNQIHSAIRSQDDWKFILNINWTGVDVKSSAEWIRIFLGLHPENSQISQKLTTDLLAASILAEKSRAAHQICKLCPQLKLMVT